MATMLYKYPKTHRNQRPTTGYVKQDGLEFDYIVIEDKQVAEALKKGWSKTIEEAKKDVSKIEIPSREILEAEANKLDISFRADIKDETLYKKIVEAKKG